MRFQILGIIKAAAVFKYLRSLRCIFFNSAEISLPINITLSYRQMCVTVAIVIVNMAT
jgi:hypothetical protein